MQRVGLNLLIFPPLPRREADVCSPAPGTSGDDGGTEARQVFLPRRPTQGKTILLPHSSTAPTSPGGKKDPLCFLKSTLAFKDPPEIRPDRTLSRTTRSTAFFGPSNVVIFNLLPDF